jgi:hypothetical protein
MSDTVASHLLELGNVQLLHHADALCNVPGERAHRRDLPHPPIAPYRSVCWTVFFSRPPFSEVVAR